MKNKITRKILAIALATLMIFSVPFSSVGSVSFDFGAVTAEAADSITWSLSGGVLTISGSGKMTDYSSGGAPWYTSKDSITSIVIEDGVTYLGTYAFASLTNVTSVDMGNTVTDIGNSCFNTELALKTIVFSPVLKTIGNYAFSWCRALIEIDLPETLESIGNEAFNYCLFLESIVIPKLVTSIGKSAFAYCCSLESVTFEGAPTVGQYAFINSYYLTNYQQYGLESTSSLTTITVLDSSISFDSTAFLYQTKDYGVGIETLILTEGDTTTYSYFSSNGYLASGATEDSVVEYVEAATTYIVKFYDYNGELLDTVTVESGVVPTTTKAPTGYSTDAYTYTFAGWAPTVVAATEDTSYTATYTSTPKTYTVKFVDEYGVVMSEETLAYGAAITVPSTEKASTAQYSYTFTGWDTTIASIVTADVTYTASYDETVNSYDITFVDGDENETVVVCEYGTTPTAPSNPTKTETAQYTYTFTNWSPSITSVTGEATYTAQFSSTTNQYTVTFMNEGTEYFSTTYNYGETLVVPASNPTKASSDAYTYTFTGWGDVVTTVTGNATYTAQYSEELRTYTITFIDGDGTTLDTVTCAYGTMPSTDETPTKTATAQYTYSFDGWDKEVVAVTGDATYTAEFTATTNSYTITFVDEDGKTVIDEVTCAYGTIPSTDETPTKAADDDNTYTFASWTPTVEAVTGEATYTATYTTTAIPTTDITLTYNVDGAETTDTQTVKEDASATFTVISDPSKTNYVFTGWTSDIEDDETSYFADDTITTSENVTLTATWAADFNGNGTDDSTEGEDGYTLDDEGECDCDEFVDDNEDGYCDTCGCENNYATTTDDEVIKEEDATDENNDGYDDTTGALILGTPDDETVIGSDNATDDYDNDTGKASDGDGYDDKTGAKILATPNTDADATCDCTDGFVDEYNNETGEKGSDTYCDNCGCVESTSTEEGGNTGDGSDDGETEVTPHEGDCTCGEDYVDSNKDDHCDLCGGVEVEDEDDGDDGDSTGGSHTDEDIDSSNCNCICHKTGWWNKLWFNFVNFFWDLFNINKVCGCGVYHYLY